MADIERLIGFMAIMQVPFMNDPDALAYIEEVKTVLKQAKAQEPGWISVKDRLPEEYGNYIAVVDGKATECTYSGPLIKGIITGWSTCESDGMKWLRDEQVTHWMPLPEPPKEGT